MSTDGDALYAALDALRKTPSPRSPAWRVVHEHVRRAVRDEDVAQEAVLRVVRGIATFEGTSTGEAVRWVRTITQRRSIDGLRKRARDPLAQLAGVRADEDETPLVERLPSAVERADEARLQPVADRVLDAVTARAAAERPATRALVVASARAAWLRIVHGLGADAIALALAPAAPPSTDALYKWVERGRAHVLDAVASLTPDDELGREALDALALLFTARRADAGRTRPGRRKRGAT